ncbi:BA75_01814T0 [Komagataella pastoris]|uniref:Peptide:N-glycanase 1 n=1 Tax=Komagataella pastoris TaxID=4922 RepID=A0A1B2J5K2_PICPA|nr:BA75_01814T0 [Komagataella pastoris]
MDYKEIKDRLVTEYLKIECSRVNQRVNSLKNPKVDQALQQFRNSPLAHMRKAHVDGIRNPQYTDDAIFQALETMDLDHIFEKANTLYKSQQEDESKKDSLDETDFTVVALLDWFKNDFFKWINKPPCPICRSEDESRIRMVGSARPTTEELSHGAGVVEVFNCDHCNSTIRFPRYNNPTMLLSTKAGRCGEWNNCFLLCLKALGLRARCVRNVEDHVWSEYYSEHLKRWVHLDSCENAFDKPELYCKGWGKKMSYCFAFDDTLIEDVSAKYITQGRLPKMLDEGTIRICLYFFNQKALQMVSENTEAFYSALVKYHRCLSANRKENGTKSRNESSTLTSLLPRQSGSASWTSERGENGL